MTTGPRLPHASEEGNADLLATCEHIARTRGHVSDVMKSFAMRRRV